MVVNTRVLYGDLLTGRITGVLDATGVSWAQTLNDSGSIDGVTVPEHLVRSLNLRREAAAAKCFLAVEQDDVIREAGPIWSHLWDWEKGQLTLGASGLWSYFDHRKVLPLLNGKPIAQVSTTIPTPGTADGVQLGGIARQLVEQSRLYAYTKIPIVLPPYYTGGHTETFPGWKLLWIGDQLRELTQRESNAPDIRFRPRRRPDDPRFIEWVMEVGTESRSQLAQVGDDWVFDATAPRGPVLGISVDQDATVMGSWAFVIGNGTEKDMLISTAYDPTLNDLGYPLLEVEESRTTVEVKATLDGHAATLRDRSSRPVEMWNVHVHADAAREVMAGHYARVIFRDDAYLGSGEVYVRVKTISGNFSDTVVLDCFPVQAAL